MNIHSVLSAFFFFFLQFSTYYYGEHEHFVDIDLASSQAIVYQLECVADYCVVSVAQTVSHYTQYLEAILCLGCVERCATFFGNHLKIAVPFLFLLNIACNNCITWHAGKY